jgi:ribosomal protein S18 acetylase RimI-like enzyme
VRRAGPAERRAVMEFIERNFGEIWAFESERAFASAAGGVVFAEEHGAIAGFAAVEANNAGLGTFGPVGTDPRTRGRGLGRALLHAALGVLREAGYPKVVIPWIASSEYYERHARVTASRRFARLEREALP